MRNGWGPLARGGWLGVAFVISLLAVPAAPATAAAVTCGTVVTTSITLTSNLAPCTGDALIAGADNITIDLGGYTIGGTGTGAGVRVAQRTCVTCQRGTIHGFHTGVVLDESTSSTVSSKLVLRDNVRASMLGRVGRQSWLRTNTVLNSGARTRSRLGLSANNVVSKNTPCRATCSASWRGLLLYGNLVEKNVIRDTRGFGVAVFSDSDSNRIEKNDVPADVQGDGISVLSHSST